MKIIVCCFVFFSFLHGTCPAQTTLEGSHCVETGAGMDAATARNLVRTIALRKALENAGVLEHMPPGYSPAEQQEVIQVLISAFLRDVEVKEHREEEGRICEVVTARADKGKLSRAVADLAGREPDYVERHGIAENGCLMVLAVHETDDRYGRRIDVVARVSRSTGPLHTSTYRARKPCFKVCMDYLAPGGVPLQGESRFIDRSAEGLTAGEIRTLDFYAPPEAESYRVWLPEVKRKMASPAPPKIASRSAPQKRRAPERKEVPKEVRSEAPKETPKDKPKEVPKETPKVVRSESGAAGVRELKGLETDDGPEGFRLDLLAEGPIEHHRHFYMEHPPRLVLDLPGQWKAPAVHSRVVNGIFVKRVRLGRHPDKLRVVLDLATGMSSPGVVFQETPGGMTININDHE